MAVFKKISLLALALLTFWGQPVFSQDDIYNTIRRSFPTASPLLIILIGSSIILILGGIVAWEIFKTDQQRREKVNLSWKNFAEYAKDRKLELDEIDLIKKLIEVGDLSQADILFQAPNLYEDCVALYIQKFKEQGDEKNIPYELLYRLRQNMGYSRLPVESHLTSSRQLNLGIAVNIRKNEKEYMKCTVKSLDEKSWSLATKEGNFLGFSSNQKISVWHIRPGDAEYRIDTDVIGVGDNTLILEHSMDFNRKQLRNWVRIDVNIPCKATLVKVAESPTSDSEDSEEEDIPPFTKGMSLEGRIIDISGGGIALRATSRIPQGSTLSLNFDLPGSSMRGIFADVLSIHEAGNQNRLFIHRLKFNDIETATQEKVVRFVFEKSRMDSQFR